MNKIVKEKEIKFSDLPDDIDLESLPKDLVIIFDDDNDPSMHDEYWEDLCPRQ